MQPDPSKLLEKTGISTPVIGLYDTPDPAPLGPLVVPEGGKRPACLFSFYGNWLAGETLHLTRDVFGCRGAGLHLFGIRHRSREEFLKFLVDFEGLKSSHSNMNEWLDRRKPRKPEHPHVCIGPLRPDRYEYLKTATFFVAPDQLSALMLGAEYDHPPGEPPAVIAPFGSGCMQIFSSFEDLDRAQAIIGATDIAMRKFIPPDHLAFTVTRPMLERLCALDEKCFLYKPFWRALRRARERAGESD